MAPIGHSVTPSTAGKALSEAARRAALMPDCLTEARRIANTVIAGWHGRKRRGTGEQFWQFRPYAQGESYTRIDWRRSARDDHAYVRDMEWEAAHTIWLHADLSPSMLFRSTLSPVSKEERALVLMLALAELLLRSGERIGAPGLMTPVANRNGAERLAHALSLTSAPPQSLPETAMIRDHADMVIFGDFLDQPDALIARIAPLAERGIRGHLMEIADPAEESFPYRGRTEFRDPETGSRLTLGRAESLRDDYLRFYQQRRQFLAAEARRLGWSFATHHTDRPASEALSALHVQLSGETAAGGRN
ncbi:DUF58 domain-containing protein [Martelella alba]|uniref:DUF58 domain-containing protein n=1 Tax=Martelella alba TaxID=2590451 RepID=A0A506UBF6_9HYPH|nr:DUF58 domain-containing protein [Martelella alba]TPW31713.1 DUF58 domain-containing protein [Martelella alba]